MSSKFNINFNFSWSKFLKTLITIIISIGLCVMFNMFFPEKWQPKDFIFKTAIYMCIYILVGLIVESIARKNSENNNTKKLR